MFFWSESWGGEACFIADFGPTFYYKNDNQKDQVFNTISFPSLSDVLAKPLSTLPSRHFPLSSTYVKFRLLQRLRSVIAYVYYILYYKLYLLIISYMSMLCVYCICYREAGITEGSDRAHIATIATAFFTSHGLDTNYLTSEDIHRLLPVSLSVLVTTCSILGSFLTQEVIKAVSRAGVPGYNVFVFSSYDYVCKAFPIN